MNKTGFTLIELICVLSLFTILALFSLPNINGFLYDTEANISKQAFMQMIYFAENKARTDHELIGICLSEDEQTCSLKNSGKSALMFFDEEENGEISATKQIIKVIRFPANGAHIDWRLFPKHQTYLQFAAHNLEGENATIWYCTEKGETKWAIMQSRSERIREVLPDKKGIVHDAKGKILTC